MRAIVDIPNGEPFEGFHILENLEIPPQVGHCVGDPNGKHYRIKEVIHLIETNKAGNYPYLKLIVEKVPQ